MEDQAGVWSGADPSRGGDLGRVGLERFGMGFRRRLELRVVGYPYGTLLSSAGLVIKGKRIIITAKIYSVNEYQKVI